MFSVQGTFLGPSLATTQWNKIKKKGKKWTLCGREKRKNALAKCQLCPNIGQGRTKDGFQRKGKQTFEPKKGEKTKKNTIQVMRKVRKSLKSPQLKQGSKQITQVERGSKSTNNWRSETKRPSLKRRRKKKSCLLLKKCLKTTHPL